MRDLLPRARNKFPVWLQTRHRMLRLLHRSNDDSARAGDDESTCDNWSRNVDCCRKTAAMASNRGKTRWLVRDHCGFRRHLCSYPAVSLERLLSTLPPQIAAIAHTRRKPLRHYLARLCRAHPALCAAAIFALPSGLMVHSLHPRFAPGAV
jgi:hypothetical protein